MIDFIYLNVFVAITFILTLRERSYFTNIHLVESPAIRRFPPLYLLVFSVGMIILTLIFLLSAHERIVLWYIRGAYTFMVILHARLLTLGKSMMWTIGAILVAIVFAMMKFSSSSELLHNIFIMTALVWIGPLLVKLSILTVRRFIIVSLVWLIYDIVFVWLTPSARVIETLGGQIGFPFAFVRGSSLIGTGDVLFGVLLLSLLSRRIWQYRAIIALVGVNIAFAFADIVLGRTSLFPLLVLWVPTGLLLLYFDQPRAVSKHITSMLTGWGTSVRT